MAMAWWKNGLIFAAGGAVGVIAGALLYEAVMDDIRYDSDEDEKPERDGITLLADKIRCEATAAMEACRTDEERENVYEQVKESVRGMQKSIAEKGEEIIAELQKQVLVAVEEAEKDAPEKNVQSIKDTMRELADSLDETLDSLKPDPTPAV